MEDIWDIDQRKESVLWCYHRHASSHDGETTMIDRGHSSDENIDVTTEYAKRLSQTKSGRFFLLFLTVSLTCFWDNNSCRLVFCHIQSRGLAFLVALIFFSIGNHDMIGLVIDISALKYHSLYIWIKQHCSIFFDFPAWCIQLIFLMNVVKFSLRRFTK